ncbi:MAG: hypothetical protein WDO24_22900 [Pseudomonadota bacterium]
MKPGERMEFSAIVDRPPLKLPDGARLVLWTIVNLEVWEIERAMARQVLPAPTGVPLLPDVPNWSWHEYGMRGRLLALQGGAGEIRHHADRVRSMPACADYYPRVASACRDGGWESWAILMSRCRSTRSRTSAP